MIGETNERSGAEVRAGACHECTSCADPHGAPPTLCADLIKEPPHVASPHVPLHRSLFHGPPGDRTDLLASMDAVERWGEMPRPIVRSSTGIARSRYTTQRCQPREPNVRVHLSPLELLPSEVLSPPSVDTHRQARGTLPCGGY